MKNALCLEKRENFNRNINFLSEYLPFFSGFTNFNGYKLRTAVDQTRLNASTGTTEAVPCRLSVKPWVFLLHHFWLVRGFENTTYCSPSWMEYMSRSHFFLRMSCYCVFCFLTELSGSVHLKNFDMKRVCTINFHESGLQFEGYFAFFRWIAERQLKKFKHNLCITELFTVYLWFIQQL